MHAPRQLTRHAARQRPRAGRGLLACVVLAAASLSSSGCEILDIRSCPAVPVWAIHVEVLDAATGLPVDDALVVARDGAYADSVRTSPFPPAPTRLALGRAGTYAVHVEHPAYAPAVRSGIRVTRGDCHVNTVTIRVELTATSSVSAAGQRIAD